MMRRVLFGLLLVPLMACCDVFAHETLTRSSNPGGSPKKLSPIGQHHPKNGEPVARTRSDARSGLLSLPLAASAAYASGHPASLPISPASRPEPPPSHSWTGFYVGGGSGVGNAQP